MRVALAAMLLGSGSALMNTDKNLFALDNQYVPNYPKCRKVRKNVKRKLTQKQSKARNKSKAAKKARRKIK